MTPVPAERAREIEAHARNQAALEGRSRADVAWLRELRAAAFDRFAMLGFPTTRDEEWRYTSAAPIARIPFTLAAQAPVSDAASAAAFVGPELDGPRLTLLNGRHASELSRTDGLPAGVVVKSLAAALREDGAAVRAVLGQVAGWTDHAFRALSTAFVEDGAFIVVPAGVAVEKPIHVAHVMVGGGSPLVAHPRNVIVLGEGARARVVETMAGDEHAYLVNAVTEVVVGASAALEHLRVQKEGTAAYHVASLAATIHRGASFRSFVAAVGAALSRNEIGVLFEGEGGECALDGLSVLRGTQHADHHTVVDHASPRCSSHELYKGVFDDRSRGVFNGSIVVRQDAQGTSAHQQNRNLLLSREALVDTKPQLTIHADDVRCTHGATIGQVDSDALFYLRSRGLDEQAARRLLTRAFAREVLDRVSVAAVAAELDTVLDRLPDTAPVTRP